MIQLEIGKALILYSGLLLGFAAAIWAYTEISAWRAHRTLGKQYLWRCVFCGFSYLDESAEHISKCPRCESLNSMEDKHARVVNVHAESPAVAEAGSPPAGRNTSKRKRPNQRRRGPRKRG